MLACVETSNSDASDTNLMKTLKFLEDPVIHTREGHFEPSSDAKTKNKEVLEYKVAQHSNRGICREDDALQGGGSCSEDNMLQGGGESAGTASCHVVLCDGNNIGPFDVEPQQRIFWERNSALGKETLQGNNLSLHENVIYIYIC